MEWIGDPSTGAWLRERIDDPWAGTMHDVVPRGFPAYARILHPGIVRSLPDRPVPSLEEWERMPEADREALIEQFRDEPVTWAEAAAAFGSVRHPLAQWQQLVRAADGEDWHSRLAPDGREFSAPAEGQLAADVLARVAGHLAAHTSTPDDAVVAVWEGWGGLLGGRSVGPSRSFFTLSDDPRHQQVLDRSFRDVFNNVFRRPTWHDGILSREISEGPRLELPGRGHVMFTASVLEVADPDWVLHVPWRDLPAEEHGFPPAAYSPSLLWPADRSWVLVSEVDHDSTIVGGPPALIEALCADSSIEAVKIPAGTKLSWDSDEVNR